MPSWAAERGRSPPASKVNLIGEDVRRFLVESVHSSIEDMQVRGFLLGASKPCQVQSDGRLDQLGTVLVVGQSAIDRPQDFL